MSLPDEKPVVYLVLGAPGSGRREIVADLIDGGLDAAEIPVVFVAAGEADADAAVSRAQVVNWEWQDGADRPIAVDWPAEGRTGFFIVEGLRNPVDQIEAFKPWLVAQGVELARVICVYHCALVAEHERLRVWYDACVHFADIVLLNHREGVENKWISDLRTRFHKACLPCLVEMVKKGRVANPALVLDQQVRRFSHWFDDDDNAWAGLIDADTEIVIEDEPGQAEPGDKDDLDLDEEDPYLARHPSGRRVKDIPDMAETLRS